MRILLSNDDGIDAVGLKILAKVLANRHEIIVVAPAVEQSAKSHAITFKTGFDYEQYEFAEGISKAYKVQGTPADCVKFGVLYLGIAPDVVVSGINNGNNLGTEILYSGTVSAATEAAYLGIAAVAISCHDEADLEQFVVAAQFLDDKLDCLLKMKMSKFSMFNINFPKDKCEKFVFTRMGFVAFSDKYVKASDEKYYLKGHKIDYPENDSDTDVEWNSLGYATIVPLILDRTDYGGLKAIDESEKIGNV